MEDNYKKAYKEVIEVLNFVPKDKYELIPQTLIDTFKEKMDNDYEFEIDINKSFEEQDLLEETKAILANIFRDYWATDYQREKIKAKEEYDLKKQEEEKKTKYNVDDLFKTQKKEIKKNTESNENNAINETNYSNNKLIDKTKKENFFEKIWNYFKKWFNI